MFGAPVEYLPNEWWSHGILFCWITHIWSDIKWIFTGMSPMQRSRAETLWSRRVCTQWPLPSTVYMFYDLSPLGVYGGKSCVADVWGGGSQWSTRPRAGQEALGSRSSGQNRFFATFSEFPRPSASFYRYIFLTSLLEYNCFTMVC